MVRGIRERRKHYVEVIARCDEAGQVTPLAIIWEDGRRFDIDRVLDVRPAASRRVGGQGMRYRVLVQGREKVLFFEGPAWFVEEIVPE